jgi:PilZ domain
MEAVVILTSAEQLPDRRTSLRCARTEDHGIVEVRVRPGHRARVVDVSAGGMLVETNHRLLPGSRVELHVESQNRRTTVRGQVLRCTVVRVRPTFVCYRGAIGFDRQLPWLADDERQVAVDQQRPAHPFRADATPGVL